MDVLGGVTSISQLLHYSHCTARQLISLYKAIQNAPSLRGEQSHGILLLLSSIQRICSIEENDIDSLLPLLISIANTASLLLNLLGSKSILNNRWFWMTKGKEIQEALQLLSDKTKLLQFHIAERTYTLLSKMNRPTANNTQDTASEECAMMAEVG